MSVPVTKASWGTPPCVWTWMSAPLTLSHARTTQTALIQWDLLYVSAGKAFKTPTAAPAKIWMSAKSSLHALNIASVSIPKEAFIVFVMKDFPA